MKKGISIWSFKNNDYLHNIKLAKQAGFEGLEISLDEEGTFNLHSTKNDVLKIKDYASSLDIKLFSVASSLYWKYSLSDDNELNRKFAQRILLKQIEIANWIGAESILVVPGSVSTIFAPILGTVDYDKVYKRVYESIKECIDFAVQSNVRIAIENVWNGFLLSPIEMKQFIDSFNSTYVVSCFDIGNILNYGSPEQWIKILSHRINKVHIKDFRKIIGNINGFVDLLSGDVNFPQIIDSLIESGYDGWVTAEITPYKYYAEASIYNISNSMDYILKNIEEKR